MTPAQEPGDAASSGAIFLRLGCKPVSISRCRHARRRTAAPAACTGSLVTMWSMTWAANSRAASTLPSALRRGLRLNSSSNTRLSITATVSRSVA